MNRPLALIIDDEPDIRELLEITLARMGIDSRSVMARASSAGPWMFMSPRMMKSSSSVSRVAIQSPTAASSCRRRSR